jgi:RNA polymerase sigma-70 factor (ECF subfamily)
MIKALTTNDAIPAKTPARSTLSETQLVDEYSGAVYKLCRSLTNTKYDADDLFQDTFLSVFSQMAKIESAENPQSFILGTAAYLWKSKRRKYARRNRLAPETEINEALDFISGSANTEDALIASDERRVVGNLVNTLPDHLKIPIVLYYTNELSIANIAATLNLPAGTVKSRLHKARKIIEKGLVLEYGSY